MTDVRSTEERASKARLALEPRDPELAFRLAVGCHGAGAIAAAGRWYGRTLAIEGAHLGAMINAASLLAAGHPRRALALFRRSVALAPDMIAGVANLGFHSTAVGRPLDVAAWLERAHALAPGDPFILGHLGGTLGDLGSLARGMRMARRALALDPAAAAALTGSAAIANKLDQIDRAIRFYRRSLAVAPGAAMPLINLRLALFECGDIDGAMAAADALVRSTRDPEHALMAAQLRVLDEHTDPEQLLAGLVAAQPPVAARDPQPRMSSGAGALPRIGILDDRFLSRTTHATTVLPLMEGLADRGLDLVFFTNLPPPEWDDVTQAYRRCGEIVWTGAMSDEDVCGAVRAAKVGILIDTASHLTGRRSGVIARRAAPVQIAYAAISSSGSAAMDYVIADEVLLPRGRPTHLSERVIRLPVGYRYRALPRPPLPATTVPPRASRGFPTFGSFNTLAKIGTGVWTCWAKLMRLVPEARLVVKASAFRDQAVRSRVAGRLRDLGVEPARLDLVPWTQDTAGHLSLIASVDVGLDSFPFNGVTTTFDALSMGVPVPVLAGRSFVGRFGECILSHVGVPELIAESPDELVAIAARLARDEDALRRYRTELPQRLADSPTARPDLMAAGLAGSLALAWQRWKNGEPPTDIDWPRSDG